MYTLLFPQLITDRNVLRAAAREMIESSPLMHACAAGEFDAVHALLVGCWPFVAGFEKAIDRQVLRMPVKRLVNRFGRQRVRAFLRGASAAVREMKEEEGSHAELWRQAAEQSGIVLNDSEPIDGVRRLLDSAWTEDPVQFFCWLAGTEYIAEELARFLCNSPRFVALFPKNRWLWGEAHLAEHDGPSHLEIDEDLARAYHSSTDEVAVARDLSDAILSCQKLFSAAGYDVFDSFMEPIIASADLQLVTEPAWAPANIIVPHRSAWGSIVMNDEEIDSPAMALPPAAKIAPDLVTDRPWRFGPQHAQARWL